MRTSGAKRVCKEQGYAFSINDGRGTGFRTEELFVVDTDDERRLTQFDESFDMHLHNECPYDAVKYEIDENGVMTYDSLSLYVEGTDS